MNPVACVPSVSIGPGLIELTRIFRWPSSFAKVRISPSTADLGKESLAFRLIGDVRLHGNRFAAGSRYIGYDLVRAFFAGGIIDDDRRTCGG